MPVCLHTLPNSSSRYITSRSIGSVFKMSAYKWTTLVAAVLVVCYVTAEEITLKLVGGSGPHEGTIFVKHGAKWGLVCDDGWSARAGTVICKQLGFERLRRVTKYNHFNASRNDEIFLDEVKCRGIEKNLGACRHAPWLRHNCEAKEAAGVICRPSAPQTTTTSTTTPTTISQRVAAAPSKNSYGSSRTRFINAVAKPASPSLSLDSVNSAAALYNTPSSYAVTPSLIESVELLGGRRTKEGYVKVQLTNSASGTICPEGWGLPEAMVVCRELGLQYADRATQADFFRGGHETMVLQSVQCQGHESSLADCRMNVSSAPCPLRSKVAGVICTHALSDLVPNITTLVESVSIQDRYMAYLTCALEEKCLSSSAYTVKQEHPRNWNYISRRLLRFSSSIANIGTADFRPRQHRSSWQWHTCHMHYHSMDVFTEYDVLDHNGNRVAEGHKASFCLEDVECQDGRKKKYSCRGQGNQGISVQCSDVYKHDIDCQWIDITDITPGQYVFKLNVNPHLVVPELSFDNNAAICDMKYSGFDVKLENCVLTRG